MIDISSPNRAGEGPKRGHYVSASFSVRPLASGRRLLKLRGMSINPHEAAPTADPVFFDRRELDPILRVYGRMVAQGEWRDYAMVGHKDFAEFAVFRRSGDAPLYRIEKRPALQTRQGQWAVIGEGGQILKRGRDLAQVLRVFDGRKFQVID